MKKIIAILIKIAGESAEIIIRYLIAKYLPGYHLHRNPPGKKAEETKGVE